MHALLLIKNQLLLNHLRQIFIVVSLKHSLHVIWYFGLLLAILIVIDPLHGHNIFIWLIHLIILEAFMYLSMLKGHLHLWVDWFVRTLVNIFMCLSCCIIQILLIIVSNLHFLVFWLFTLLLYFLKELWIVLLKLIRLQTLHFKVLRLLLQVLRLLSSNLI